jgi:hypothetical protein
LDPREWFQPISVWGSETRTVTGNLWNRIPFKSLWRESMSFFVSSLIPWCIILELESTLTLWI